MKLRDPDVAHSNGGSARRRTRGYKVAAWIEAGSSRKASGSESPSAWDNAPQSIEDDAERRRVEAETARIEEETRAIEIRNAELRGEIKGRSERRAA